MLCRYTFSLESNVKLDHTLIFQIGDRQFELVPEDGRLAALAVEISGLSTSDAGSVDIPDSRNAIPHIRVCAPALDEIKAQIHAFRGALAMWGVFAIDTELPKSKFVAETDAERDQMALFGFEPGFVPPHEQEPKEGPLDLIIRTIVSSDRFIELAIPFEFYRRGRQDVLKRQYIEAFYDFFFCVEFLFADGKYKKKSMEQSFHESAELMQAIRDAVRHFRSDRRIFTNLSKSEHQYFSRHYSKSAEEAASHVIDVRGFLHHQSGRRPENWDPSSQVTYRVHAHFLEWVCLVALQQVGTPILFEEDEMQRFQQTTVSTSDGRRVNWDMG